MVASYVSDDPITVGNAVEWTITVRQRDGTTPLAGMITDYRAYSRSPTGAISTLPVTVLPSPEPLGRYRITCQFTSDGDWFVRFETDGIETAHERYYHVLPSAFPSPA